MCRLKKALCDLKHAPMTWYGRIDNFLTSLGFTKSKEDSNLYYKVEDGLPSSSFTTGLRKEKTLGLVKKKITAVGRSLTILGILLFWC